MQQFSFEFFPPKTDEGRLKLQQVRNRLQQLQPHFVSVTFGAGGSTQDGTMETVADMLQNGIDAAPHLSCIGSTKKSVAALLQQYVDLGVCRIVALRGDMPSGMRETGELHHANELVTFIREQHGDHFTIEVAAYPETHPQAASALEDIDFFVQKVEAGANSAITQYFYNVDAYHYFVDACAQRGVNIPIYPGIMPITNIKQLARFSAMCGAEIPRWLRLRLEAYGDDMASLRQFGLDFTADFCQKLLDAGVPGLHFYSMNQAGPIEFLYQQLGLTPAE